MMQEWPTATAGNHEPENTAEQGGQRDAFGARYL